MITSQVRRSIQAAHLHVAEPLDIVISNCEIDHHADTCCLGANFIPLYFTRKVCDVILFLESMPVQGNVKVCAGATVYEDDNGTTNYTHSQ